jgi:hypothetical protein
MAENLDATCPEIIGKTRHEWTLRSHHDKPHIHQTAKRKHRRVIGNVQNDILAAVCCSRVAWRYEELCQLGTAHKGAGQSMLASARADQQNIHGYSL